MTLVVCPNLAIDRVLLTDRVRPGGMSRCRELRTQAGGKGSNVLRATRALGGEGLLVGFAAGHGGRRIVELARDEGLELEVIEVDGEARVSTVVLGDDGSATRLFELGPAIGEAEERALADLAGRRPATAGEWAVVTGAAPPGASPGFYGALVRAGRAAGYRVLVDATGEQLRGALVERPDLVKVTVDEASSAVGAAGVLGDTVADAAPAAHGDAAADAAPAAHGNAETDATPATLEAEGLELARRLCDAGAAGAVVTLGATGAAGILGGARWRVTVPPTVTVNPVGSGDCFSAGLALALQRGEDAAAALRLAAAAGAANAASAYTGHVDPALVAKLAGEAVAGPPASG